MADFKHLLLGGTRTASPYTTIPRGGPGKSGPPRPERKSHGAQLLSNLERALKKAQSRKKRDATYEGIQFIPMRFDESPNFELELKRLESESKGIKVVSVKERAGHKEYVIAVPDSQVEGLEAKLRDYQDEDTPRGKPKNEPLVSSISKIDSANLEDYWTDDPILFPTESEKLWWEVWLDTGESHSDIVVENWFRSTAQFQTITLSPQKVFFPHRLVILAYASFSQWRIFPGLLRYLAEFRRANIVSGEFTNLPPAGQAEYINDFLERTKFANDDAVRVCILDTGINRGHILLDQAISEEDVQAWDQEWGTNDHTGHGTEMAGVCLFGPLNEPIYGDENIELQHRLESVKILPNIGRNDPPDYGPITVGSMALAEAAAPMCQRVFCMAVTAEGEDQWRPTLWSAALDQAAAGATDGYRRLIVVSAGNLRDDIGKNYPHENLMSSVEDPAQSWNALTVGGYTNFAWMQEQGLEGYRPIAKPGTLSPSSRTSLCWGEEPWPYKPDVVFEGGNYAIDGSGYITSADDLEILTTRSSDDGDALLGTIRDTSAATAQAARMGAILQSEYPEYWPETIRGLIVHSAEWTPQMLEEFPRSERKNRLRVYGMGVPRLERARRSASGFATMVIQDELQPFKFGSGDNATNEMHFHDLPLSRDILEDLAETQVRMRVTLSYFIEPNPPRRGYVARHHYASHRLHFSVRRPQEISINQMGKRLSSTFWDKDDEGKVIRPPKGSTIADDRAWDLGPTVIVQGSIHSDAWTGTAAQLALSNLICVYPVAGWWRYRRDPSVVEQKARYSLVVSISTEEEDIDLYTMIQNEIATRTGIKSGEVTTEIG